MRRRSPLTQGKKQHVRKINRKTGSIWETRVSRERRAPPPQALAENHWAGGRHALRLQTSYASPGGRKGAQNECSNLGSHCPLQGSLGVWRDPGPWWSFLRAIIPGSKGSQNQRYKLLVLKQAPTNLNRQLLQCSESRTQACLAHIRIQVPSTVPDTQQVCSKHLLSKCLEEKARPAGQCTKGQGPEAKTTHRIEGWGAQCKRD